MQASLERRLGQIERTLALENRPLAGYDPPWPPVVIVYEDDPEPEFAPGERHPILIRRTGTREEGRIKREAAFEQAQKQRSEHERIGGKD